MPSILESPPAAPAILRQRIKTLRKEIAHAEQKNQGIFSAIESRRKTLSRLEAQLALAGTASPDQTMSD